MTSRRFLSTLTALAAAASLAACAVGPVYERPAMDAPTAWKEAPAAEGWLPAAPADALDRGPWWQLFGDAGLDALAQRVQASNQTIAIAVANYAQARALVREQRAQLFPTVSLSAGADRRGGRGASSTGNSSDITLGADWAPDVWGRLGQAVGSAEAQAAASEADLAAARLSALGELASNYFALREADAELALLAATLEGYERSLTIARNRYEAGIAAQSDVLQAQTILVNTRAERVALQRSRDTLEHAIAVLVGAAPADFRLPVVDAWMPTVPAVPLGVPSTLLQRRPDIASAERAVAAANAQIGIARSAYYPSFSLSASAGRSSSRVSDLFSASNTLWSIGLSAAQLSALGELAANYFQLREADAELALLGATLEGYERSLAIARNRYEAGIAAQSDVLQAQTILVNTRAERVALQRSRDTLEHAIAVLVGAAPADFRLPVVDAWTPTVPAVPLGVPSTLLQRRPDIASAERAVAAANAQIGIERSAYYPSFSLSASVGRSSSRVSDLFSASNTLWSIGLSAAQVLFDAGAIGARVDSAKAAHDAAVARYRQTVLTAFQGVEDQLTATASLAQQEALRREASAAADRTEQQILNRYRAGQVGYTEVVTAQASALSARRTVLQLQVNRQTAAVGLIQGLGGGWQAPG